MGVNPDGLCSCFPRLLFVSWLTLPISDFLTVEMAGKTQTVLLNHNANISCKVPGSPHLNLKIVGIRWFFRSQGKETEHKLFEFFGDQQNSFRSGASVSLLSLERGDASLHLSAVQLREAGEYCCEVVITPYKAQGTVHLEVVASPVSILLEKQDNDDRLILCESSGFYPKDINITWHKRTQENPQYLEFSEGITTGPAIKNEDGTFNVTSLLRLKHSLEHNMTTYECVINHISLPTPRRLNYNESGTGGDDPAGQKHLPGAERGSKMRSGWWIINWWITGLCFTFFGLCVYGILFGLISVVLPHKRRCHRQQTFSMDTY